MLPIIEYERLELGELKTTKMVIQLADRSTELSRGVVEDVLIRVGEFIYPVDFVVFETNKVANIASQIPVILGRPFLATSNALIHCRNGMTKLSFGNMALELNILNLQRQPLGFDDIETSTLNWIDDSIFYDEFDDMFTTEYESFFIDHEPEYDICQFDNLCFDSACLIASACQFESPHTFVELKPLPDSLKYAFLGPDESLPVIIASDPIRG